MERVSFVIPTYKGVHLPEVLHALSLQTRPADEVVIVVDGETMPFSTEHTVITIPHSGACTARNTGFTNTTGDFVVFLDDDTLLAPTWCEALLSSIGSYDIAYCDYVTKGMRSFVQCGIPFDQEKLQERNYIDTTSLIRRSVLPDTPFDPAIERLQDWDLYLTLIENGATAVYVPKMLMRKYCESDGISVTKNYDDWYAYVRAKHNLGT